MEFCKNVLLLLISSLTLHKLTEMQEGGGGISYAPEYTICTVLKLYSFF